MSQQEQPYAGTKSTPEGLKFSQARLQQEFGYIEELLQGDAPAVYGCKYPKAEILHAGVVYKDTPNEPFVGLEWTVATPEAYAQLQDLFHPFFNRPKKSMRKNTGVQSSEPLCIELTAFQALKYGNLAQEFQHVAEKAQFINEKLHTDFDVAVTHHGENTVYKDCSSFENAKALKKFLYESGLSSKIDRRIPTDDNPNTHQVLIDVQAMNNFIAVRSGQGHAAAIRFPSNGTNPSGPARGH